MKLNKKANVILVSLGAIALAGSVIAGSTYALFTSESKTNIAITAGKVDVSATIGDLETYSGVDLTGDPDTDVIEKTAVKGVFTNGGTAKISSDGTLELANVTPGDKATFKIEVSNKSNVTIKYRTIISYSNDDGLFSGLDLTVGDYQFDGTTYKSSWTTLEPSEDTNIASLDCVALLPSDAGNEYQGKTCKINYSIEAVQGNAYTEDDKYVTFSLSSEDETKGTVTGGGTVEVGDQVTITATPASGYTFKGWYQGKSLISAENPYTFTVPSNSLSYVAKFVSEAEEELNKKLGITPVIDKTNLTITYGLYPQSRVSDDNTLSALNALPSQEGDSWYLYQNEYYAKEAANPYSNTYGYSPYFTDEETSIVSGQEYWYKCEPITWKILEQKDGVYSVLSTILLDAHAYNDDRTTNSYEKSGIRKWLNDDFFNSAFKLDSSLIQTTTVDNSLSTTKSTDDINPSENTQDKIYLLSYKDYLNADYGFPTKEDYTGQNYKRKCKPTDYALANGAYFACGDGGGGDYWTRSPESHIFAWYIDYDGGMYHNGYVDDTTKSVRPAMTIKLS